MKSWKPVAIVAIICLTILLVVDMLTHPGGASSIALTVDLGSIDWGQTALWSLLILLFVFG
jgi:hypothetical protein